MASGETNVTGHGYHAIALWQLEFSQGTQGRFKKAVITVDYFGVSGLFAKENWTLKRF